MKDVNKIRIIILLLIAAAGTMGCMLSYILAKRNYMPLEGLARLLRDRFTSEPADWKTNEFQWMVSSVQSLFQQENELKSRMERDKPFLVNACLSELLEENSGKKEESVEILRLLEIRIPHPLFFCLAVRERGNARLGQDSSQLIEDICAGLGILVWKTEKGGNLVVICNCQSEEQYQYFNECMDESVRARELNVSAGIGCLYGDLLQLHLSYKEAVTALDYRLVKGPGSVIPYKGCFNESRQLYYPNEVENSFANYLRSGDYEKAMKAFQEIVVRNVDLEHPNIHIIKNLFFNMEMSAIHAARDLGIQGDTLPESGELFRYETMEEMRDYIEKIIYHICSTVNAGKDSHNTQLRDQIVEFMEQSISDPSLSLGSVAERFKISAPYLSKFFKEQLGCNFLDYISRRRIKFAKHLMENESADIEMVAGKVGYSNSVTFRRVFKKYEGITPSQYRDSI